MILVPLKEVTILPSGSVSFAIRGKIVSIKLLPLEENSINKAFAIFMQWKKWVIFLELG